MTLTEKQRRHLRGLAHPLEPVILIGQHGVTDGVVRETLRALDDHELIKVKARIGDRDARDRLFAELEARTASERVQRIGNVCVLYRRHPKLPGIILPGD